MALRGLPTLSQEHKRFMNSQFGQDRFVLQLLGGMREGFFLDSGAADGIEVSNTLLLESEFGWTGICIEPNPVFFAALIKNRQCHCVNSCLYDREGPVEFVEASFLGGIREEYGAQQLKYVARRHQGQLPIVTRTARTLRSVLREYNAPRVIDYWSLDTEGSELTILKSFPFDEYTFRVLTVEHNCLPVQEEIRLFLESRGYGRVRTIEIDDCYLQGWKPSRPMWRSYVWSQRSS